MSTFDKALPSYRLVATRHGDDLQAIAAREMGDANRWYELAWINDLQWPYIVNDARQALGARVVVAGNHIRVPSPQGLWRTATDDARVFGSDCAMNGRMLTASESGDLDIVSGSKNLKQQLEHRLNTPRGQMRRHPDYGSMAPKLKGAVNGPVASILAASYTRSALEADRRVSDVVSVQGSVDADVISVRSTVQTVSGLSVDVLTEI